MNGERQIEFEWFEPQGLVIKNASIKAEK